MHRLITHVRTPCTHQHKAADVTPPARADCGQHARHDDLCQELMGAGHPVSRMQDAAAAVLTVAVHRAGRQSAPKSRPQSSARSCLGSAVLPQGSKTQGQQPRHKRARRERGSVDRVPDTSVPGSRAPACVRGGDRIALGSNARFACVFRGECDPRRV